MAGIRNQGALVADFGLAHTFGSAEEHNGGTPRYMAPELLAGGGNSPRADQWAFCVSLWEAIEGVRPFDGKNPVSLLESIEAGDANVGSPDAMPPRLRVALRRGLAVEPGKRWPSMDALVDELDGILAQPSEPRAKERPRPPGGFLVFTILGGLIGALVVALYMGPQPEPPGPASHVERTRTEGPSTDEADPLVDALRGFADARSALDNGEPFDCYEKWLGAYPRLRTLDPGKAGRDSLELAKRMQVSALGDQDAARSRYILAARIAIGAARAFEELAGERLPQSVDSERPSEDVNESETAFGRV